MKKQLHFILGVILALCLIMIDLITSIEAVCYWTPGYFEQEYKKYDVLSSLPEMSMSEEDGLMAVTHHMMKYLRGDSDAPELQITVRMGGEERGFFTEREIAHMADVRALFIGAQRIRALSLCLCLMIILYEIVASLFGKKTQRSLPGASNLCIGMLCGIALFLVLSVVFGVVIASDFTAAFITFHHLFFTNDLWLLDPSVDMLINIVPEGFFFDTATRILLCFAACLLVLSGLALLFLRRSRMHGIIADKMR